MTAQDQIDVVTGAFSYSGAAIAVELRARGHRVRTLGIPGGPRAALTSTSVPLTSRTQTAVPVPGQLIPSLSFMLGVLLRDVLLTRDEYLAMAAGLADSDAPATGYIAFTDWLAEHGQELGQTYANEINLHFRPGVAGEPDRLPVRETPVSPQIPPQRSPRPARDPDGVGSFLAWAMTGACLGIGLLTAATIGPYLLPLGVIAAAVLIWRRRLGLPAIGAVSGLGLISLTIAYLNRNGPGQVCTTTATAQSCITEWSPWPWLAAGIVLIGTGLMLFLALRQPAGPGISR